MTMETIKAKLLNRMDSWHRPLATDKEGNIYADINCGDSPASWHTTTEDGEPSYPVNLIIE